MKLKADSILVGHLLGLVTPFVVIVLYNLVKFHSIVYLLYLPLELTGKLISSLVGLSGIPNLLVFFLFLNKNKYWAARGVILATFILVIIVIVVKILS